MSFVIGMTQTLLLAAFVGFILPFVVAVLYDYKKTFTVAALLAPLALVGASAGLAGGMSRAAAVGDIVPAFLGLLGGISLYLFGIDQSRGVVASFGAAVLSIALVAGFSAGSSQRLIPEDHRDLRSICVAAYMNPDLTSNPEAFAIFLDKMEALCHRAMGWHLPSET